MMAKSSERSRATLEDLGLWLLAVFGPCCGWLRTSLSDDALEAKNTYGYLSGAPPSTRFLPLVM